MSANLHSAQNYPLYPGNEHMKALADIAAANATVLELRSQIERDDQRHADKIKRLENIIERLTTPRRTIFKRIFRPSSRFCVDR